MADIMKRPHDQEPPEKCKRRRPMHEHGQPEPEPTSSQSSGVPLLPSSTSYPTDISPIHTPVRLVHRTKDNRPRPYVCDICHRRFTKLSNKDRHRKLHTGEKPYVCNICSNKAFARLSCLRRHQKSHSRERLLVCSFCGKRFVHSSDLRRHQVHQHSQLPAFEREATLPHSPIPPLESVPLPSPPRKTNLEQPSSSYYRKPSKISPVAELSSPSPISSLPSPYHSPRYSHTFPKNPNSSQGTPESQRYFHPSYHSNKSLSSTPVFPQSDLHNVGLLPSIPPEELKQKSKYLPRQPSLQQTSWSRNVNPPRNSPTTISLIDIPKEVFVHPRPSLYIDSHDVQEGHKDLRVSGRTSSQRKDRSGRDLRVIPYTYARIEESGEIEEPSTNLRFVASVPRRIPPLASRIPHIYAEETLQTAPISLLPSIRTSVLWRYDSPPLEAEVDARSLLRERLAADAVRHAHSQQTYFKSEQKKYLDRNDVEA